MSWLSLALGLLKLCNFLLDRAEKQRIIDMTTKGIIADQLAQISENVKVTAEVRARISKLSDEELDDLLIGGDQ